MKYIYIIAMIVGLFTRGTAQVTLNFESGNRSVDVANCWVFGAVGYSSTSGHRITGSWVGRTNALTNNSPSACWIKSPWLKPGSGNITFNAKHENTNGTSRSVRVRFIPYDSTKAYGEGSVITDSLQYNYSSFNTTAAQLTFAIPTSIANSSNPYKVMISFIGQGGTNRIHIDDIVIPGTYWADPSNNCLPLSLIQDADNDGVADADDNYPNDKYRAFDNYLNGSQYGTLLCEDLWPGRGDYDFNDLVVDYRINIVANANMDVVEMKMNIITRAIGGSYKNGFAIQLTDIAANKILSVTGNKITGNLFSIAANGTENNQTWANIPVFDDAFKVMNGPGGFSGVNTNPDAPKVSYDSMTVVVTFMNNGTEAPGGKVTVADLFAAKRFNPYLIVNQTRGHEIHLADYPPTSLVNTNLFGKEQDNSNPSQGRYYRTANNLPWMIFVSSSIPYTTEKTEFSKAFTKFVDWAASNGAAYTDWYTNQGSYRDASFIYNK